MNITLENPLQYKRPQHGVFQQSIYVLQKFQKVHFPCMCAALHIQIGHTLKWTVCGGRALQRASGIVVSEAIYSFIINYFKLMVFVYLY